jgi:hypothetical protein
MNLDPLRGHNFYYKAIGRNHNVKPNSDWPPDDPMAPSGMVCVRCGLVGVDQCPLLAHRVGPKALSLRPVSE